MFRRILHTKHNHLSQPVLDHRTTSLPSTPKQYHLMKEKKRKDVLQLASNSIRPCRVCYAIKIVLLCRKNSRSLPLVFTRTNSATPQCAMHSSVPAQAIWVIYVRDQCHLCHQWYLLHKQYLFLAATSHFIKSLQISSIAIDNHCPRWCQSDHCSS